MTVHWLVLVAALTPTRWFAASGSKEACSSSRDSDLETSAHVMLQVHRHAKPSHADAASLLRQSNGPALSRTAPNRYNVMASLVHRGANGECLLPEGAIWCEVRLDDLQPFWMAVYDPSVKEDWVSANICQTGYWEYKNMVALGPPGHMLDIGANLGYVSFAFAQAGWTVTTFEPMFSNLEMMAATLCRNPLFAPKVAVNWFGLGTTNQECRMVAPRSNVGDGFTRCADKADVTPQMWDEGSFDERGSFSMRRLDEVLSEQGITQIDFVKIDVEGYEAQVLDGAPRFLAQYHPRLVKSEVWKDMVGSSGMEYLDRFRKEGYKVFEDGKCDTLMNAEPLVTANGNTDVFLCKVNMTPTAF